MSFNDDAGLDLSQVTGGGGLGRGGVAVGGGLGTIVLVVVYVFLGGNPGDLVGQNGLLDGGQVTASDKGTSVDLSKCRTGADANRDAQCRIVGTVNSVQDYWGSALETAVGRPYRQATTVIYEGRTASPCGTASDRTGPFYCPSDERIYVDAAFFDELTSRFGADQGALAQEYVIAHEYGHHVQNILGILDASSDGRTGATSNGVRVELMADCMAGVWADHASSTTDEQGRTLLDSLTERDIDSALSAAAAVGDDSIARTAGVDVEPETWTHGSAEQRQRWFLTGYESGDVNACDTFESRTP